MENRKRGIPLLKEKGGVYDVWDRNLAPSPELLKWWKKESPTLERWGEYEKRFQEEVPYDFALRRLLIHEKAAREKEVVLVCEEEDREYPYCHTFILLSVYETYRIPAPIEVPKRLPPPRKVREKPPPKKLWEVTFRCPICHKLFSRAIEAETSLKAEKTFWGKTIECPSPLRVNGWELHKFAVKPEHIVGTVPYPWKPPAIPLGPKRKLGVPTIPARARKPPVEREAPTILKSSERVDNIVYVTIQRGRETLGITIPAVEVEAYDKLIRIARASDMWKTLTWDATLLHGILAFLIAHGGGCKSLITGFLRVSGFPEATTSSVGEALSRLKREGIIYRFPAEFTFTYHPLGAYGVKEKKPVSTIMGEPVYGIPTATRMKILERLKFEPYLAWWRPEILKYVPPTIPRLKKPVEYEWIRFTKPAPRFRAVEDFKYYGPYRTGEIAKLPIATAYFIVTANYAEWLNPKKENVVKTEKTIKAKYTPKQIRGFQVRLGLFKSETEEK